jgi:hypothetical protein
MARGKSGMGDAEFDTINLYRLCEDTVGRPIIDPMLFGLLSFL